GVLTVVDATYKFYRPFPAKGTIVFSGDAENPSLDLVARLEDKHVLPGSKTENVAIIMTIKGTRKEPFLTYSIEREGKSVAYESQDDINADAILFILTGKFKKEFTQPELIGTAVSAAFAT